MKKKELKKKRASFLGESESIRADVEKLKHAQNQGREKVPSGISSSERTISCTSRLLKKKPSIGIYSRSHRHTHLSRTLSFFLSSFLLSLLLLFSRCSISMCCGCFSVDGYFAAPPLWLVSSPLFPVPILSNPFPFFRAAVRILSFGWEGWKGADLLVLGLTLWRRCIFWRFLALAWRHLTVLPGCVFISFLVFLAFLAFLAVADLFVLAAPEFCTAHGRRDAVFSRALSK